MADAETYQRDLQQAQKDLESLQRRVAALEDRQQPTARSTTDQQSSSQRQQASPLVLHETNFVTQSAIATTLEPEKSRHKARRSNLQQIRERISTTQKREEVPIDRILEWSHHHRLREQEIKTRAEQRKTEAVDALASGELTSMGSELSCRKRQMKCKGKNGG